MCMNYLLDILLLEWTLLKYTSEIYVPLTAVLFMFDSVWLEFQDQGFLSLVYLWCSGVNC